MKFISENRTILIIISAYIIFFSIFVSFRHYNFQTQAWDMGIFMQTFWNTIHGQIMQNSIEEIPNHLGVHMSPWLFLLIPGFALFPSPYFLLIIQTIFIGLGALPLYLLAKRVLQIKIFPLLIAIGYLLYPSLHWINLFDFHSISFFIPLLLFAFYFFEIKKLGWSGLFFILAASTQEDAIIAVFFAGLYILIKQGGEKGSFGLTTQQKFGIVIILLSAFYFLLSTQVLMPAFGGGLLRIDRYANLGNTPVEIIQNIVTKPLLLLKTIFTAQKIRYLFWLFLPALFLPFFSWQTFILIIPGLAENLLTTFNSQFTGLYQYDSLLIPGVFIGVIYGLKNILNRYPQKTVLIRWILITTVSLGFVIHSPINPVFFPTDIFKSNTFAETMHKIVKNIPGNSSVSAHTNAVPHLANREHIYTLGTEPFPPDFIILDAEDNFGFPDMRSLQDYFDSYYNSGNYDLSVIKNRFLILSKKKSGL